jgi:hypothetical protein
LLSALRADQISPISASAVLAAASWVVGTSILRCEITSDASALMPDSRSAASMVAATASGRLRSNCAGSLS